MKLRIQLLALLACLLTSCVPLRTFFFMMPDQKDGQRFPSTTIAQNPNQSPFEFSYQQEGKDYGDLLRMNDLGDRGVDWVSTREFIKKRYTTSFLLIRNDTILYEEYFRKSVAEEQRASFSMAKSITSMLLGIAIDEGHIQSLEQPITDFIPELAGLGEFSEVQILHLLNHTSGIKQENVVRVSDIYYGHNLLKQAKKAPFEAKPGKLQRYVNMNTYLLGLAISRAVKQPLSDYLSEKVWQPLGMESDAYWSIDKKNHAEKTFCCFHATARDYAKIGRLYLQKGEWEGEQIVPKKWIEETIRRDTTEGSSLTYNRCWYLGEKRYGDFWANGMYNQHIYVAPTKNIVIIRLGDPDKSPSHTWHTFFRQLVDQL